MGRVDGILASKRKNNNHNDNNNSKTNSARLEVLSGDLHGELVSGKARQQLLRGDRAQVQLTCICLRNLIARTIEKKGRCHNALECRVTGV